jgi:hypothetical protein
MHFLRCFVVSLTFGCLLAQNEAPVATEIRQALDGIQSSSLRKDLTYIASDELEGRDSPSRGLDLAADYIAEQFRAAGLEPGVSGSYFQNAAMLVEEANYSDFELKLMAGQRRFEATPREAVLSVRTAVDLKEQPLVKLDLSKQDVPAASQLEGKVVMVEIDAHSRVRYRALTRMLREAKPALVILLDPKGLTTRYRRPRQLLDASDHDAGQRSPRVTLTGDRAARFFGALKPGDGDAMATVHIAAPHSTPATLRNVIGVLRGSDPALKDECVMLTAHYDHLGVRADGGGDRIYNGANDDGSGTVSVMEVARALARLPQHPKRSIVFMTFFGEEEGLIGSEYYVHHPVWPLEKTVADLNLEQVGRTDSSEGRQLSNASLTGFDYSDLTGFVQQAGQNTGIRVYKNLQGSDAYFSQSDNFSFAEVGVPAETLCVAFEFPDYHAVGDEAQKIDYENMAKVDRAIALSMLLMADSEKPVEWNQNNPKTAPFVKAEKRRGLD